MSSYSKISIGLAIENILLYVSGMIVKIFNSNFSIWYVVLAQFSLLIAQIICLIMQISEFREEYKNG